MKTFTKLLTFLAAASLFAAGCVNEDPAYKKDNGGDKPEPEITDGYLAIGAMNMRVVFDDQTETQPDDTTDETTRPQKAVTRTNPDTDNFIVEIYDADEAVVLRKTYAELKQMTEAVALPVGNYRLEARSEMTPPAKEWERPVYTGSKEFSIIKNQTTTIDNLVCTLANIKVTLACSVDLSDMLSAQTVSSVTLGDQTMTFAKGEKRAAYFMPVSTLNTLKFQLSGTFADTGSPVQFSKTIPNVKAGQWRKITLVITYADKGDIKFDIKVDNFVQDEEIVVNGTEGLWEQVFEEIDPTAPTIEWPGHDLSKPFQLKASMFDANGNCTEPFLFDLTSPNGIESLMVTIGSNNADFLESLQLVNIPTSFDLCEVDPTSQLGIILRGFGFPVGDEVKGQSRKSFNLAGQMPLLYHTPGYEGTHTFSFDMTDGNGLIAEQTLSILVDKANEIILPTIVWTDHDIDQVYVLSSDLTIDIVVAADAGIRSLEVTIVSETLVPELGTLNPPIPANFELCTVDGALAEILSGFGFPVGNQVKNQTSVPFSLTPFIVMLDMFDGQHNFVLKVTDNNGATTEKTIKLLKQ